MFFKPSIEPRTKTRLAALDAVRANIMIADPDLTIIHVNPAAMAMMRAVEADLAKELPRFSVATLVGSNIDVFHRNPDHQRIMLKGLDTRHDTTIAIGGHTFDITVTPILESGERIGFTVEWGDAAMRLRDAGFAAQSATIDRSQAIIEFSPDRKVQYANANFLRTMGYSLEEVQGQNHRMFVDPAYGSSKEYEQFWTSLQRGTFHAAQYRRVGKNGKDVWIEGSYNPIVDASGKVVKIVKFAFDISGQMALLTSLKASLEQADSSVNISETEAGAASTAADETAANVQSVAASAEELAASTREIASSMATTRKAAEDVEAQAQAVGTSTDAMAGAAQAMNGIVGLIRSIASQINLLALNATIEAARAGDAGKGFAVVASEVKNLAIQAAKATEQITSEIDGLQTISTDVARAIIGIRDSVGTVREQVTLTASAVEEQSAVTSGMSNNMQSASTAVAAVSTNIGNISAAVQQVAQAISQTSELAKTLVK